MAGYSLLGSAFSSAVGITFLVVMQFCSAESANIRWRIAYAWLAGGGLVFGLLLAVVFWVLLHRVERRVKRQTDDTLVVLNSSVGDR